MGKGFVIFSIIFMCVGWAVLFLLAFETGISFFSKTAPSLPSQRKMRKAVANEITKHYGNAKTVLDIGSGWGGMARGIARILPGARVIGIEKFLLPFSYSFIIWILFGPRNARFFMGDAFKFINREKGKGNGNYDFDIGIAYLLTPMMPKVEKVMDKFKVLITLDFPLPNASATRTIKLHKDHLGQHYLYVYENADIC